MRADVAVFRSRRRQGRRRARAGVAGYRTSAATWDRSLAGLRARISGWPTSPIRIVDRQRDLCSDQAPQSGLVLQNALEYAPAPARARPRPRSISTTGRRSRRSPPAVRPPWRACGRTTSCSPIAGEASGARPPPPDRLDRTDARPATYAPIEAAQASGSPRRCGAGPRRSPCNADSRSAAPRDRRPDRLRLRRAGAAGAGPQRLGGRPARLHFGGAGQPSPGPTTCWRWCWATSSRTTCCTTTAGSTRSAWLVERSATWAPPRRASGWRRRRRTTSGSI